MQQRMTQSMQAYADERGEMDLQDRLLRQAAETLEFTPSEAQLMAELPIEDPFAYTELVCKLMK